MRDYFATDNFGADLTISANEYDSFREYGMIEVIIRNEEGESSVVLDKYDIINLKTWIDTIVSIGGEDKNE